MGERDPVGKIRQNEPRVGAVKMPPAKARGLMLKQGQSDDGTFCYTLGCLWMALHS